MHKTVAESVQFCAMPRDKGYRWRMEGNPQAHWGGQSCPRVGGIVSEGLWNSEVRVHLCRMCLTENAYCGSAARFLRGLGTVQTHEEGMVKRQGQIKRVYPTGLKDL